MSYISLSQAFAQWQELAADIPQDDVPMLAESWNDYTDSLCKDGELCALQYHYAPAYDEDMPGDGSQFDELSDDREFILSELGLTMRATRKEGTREGWDASASHWRITLRRDRASMTTDYSMGTAYTGSPELADVLNCLMRDAECGAQSFEDFCAALGYDTDSRSAEKTWRACKATARNLARLFNNDMLRDLRELFEDF